MVKLITLVAIGVLALQVQTGQAGDGVQTRSAADKLKTNEKSETKCGSFKDVSKKVEQCASVLVEILEGSIKEWPKEPKDMSVICERFEKSEKCIRDVSRNCLVGLQRTITSTFASALTRTRKRECELTSYPGNFKMMQCVEKNQVLAQSIMRNITDHLRIITDQITDLDRKTMFYRSSECIIQQWKML